MSILRISPSVGEFSDIGCDLIYVIRFTISNTSNASQRIRFKPPESNAFKLLTLPQNIAPGLKQEIEVEFCTRETRDFNDSFSVIANEQKLEVPLHAWFPRPSIHFKDDVNLGVIPVQHNASYKLQLTNIGKSPGTFKFKHDGMSAGLTVTPHSGTVEAGSSKEVQVNYFGAEAGLFVSVIQVVLPEQSTRQLKVTARVVESKVDMFASDNTPVTGALDFGTVYFGQKRSIDVTLMNSSPFSTSFTVHTPEVADEDLEEDSRPSTPLPPPIEALPTDGRITKLSSTPVKFLFQPIFRDGRTGFVSKQKKPEPVIWRQTFTTEFVETEQRMEVVLTGRAVHTDVELSQSSFRFGDTAVNDHLDMLVTASNNAELPVDMDISKVAQFHVRASSYRIGPPWRLQPRSDMNLIITFKPNQLGKFSKTLNISLCGGIRTIPIHVSGVASALGTKKPLMGGTDRTAADFRRELKFVPEQPSSAPSGQLSCGYSDTNKAKGAEYAWMADGTDEVAMLQVNELEQRREHRHLYNKYITRSRLNREHNQQLLQEKRLEKKERTRLGSSATIVEKSLVDIGMVPAEGLMEPEPHVPIKNDPLWKADTGRSRSDGEGNRLLSKTTKFDENRIIKKKFKKEPTTLNEQRECKLVLSPKDICHVTIGPKVLDFGKVSVFSTNVKSFCVQNGLKTHIQVKIPVSIRDELRQSFPASQVIPPGQTAGFDINFKSDSEQNFTQAMWFQLNDNHKLKFLLLAEAVPIDIGLSQEKMDFRFSDFVLDPTLTQHLTLTNKGNSAAQFDWNLDDSKEQAFSFYPSSDTIPPHGQRNIDITYTPQQLNESACSASLDIVGGSSKKLLLTGAVLEAKCAFNTQKIDFGSVAVGSSFQKVVTIRSLGPNSTVFSITSLPPGVTVSSSRGRLAVNQSVDVIVTLKPTQATAIQSQITCTVRGMKQVLKLLIKADPKIPQVDLSVREGELNFERVFVGTTEYRHVKLINTGSIPATLLLDLSVAPDFALCDTNHKLVECTAEPEDDDPSKGGAMIVTRDSDEDESADDLEDDGSDDCMVPIKRGRKYRLTVNERCTLECSISFSPSTVTQQPHTFPLLLSLDGIPVTESHELMKQVTAEALKPRLVLSHNAIDFGPRVVVKEGTSKIVNTVSLRLTNEVDDSLHWELVLPSDIQSEAFRITPSSGVLQSGHTASVQVSFFPSEVKYYHMKVGVCLDQNRSATYMDITASGHGANPALTFDRREVILPVVPLDVASRVSFVINNEGYESLDLKWKLPGAAKYNEPGTLPIQVNFPDGSAIGHHHSHLVVEVVCIAKKPISFTASIDFMDDDDGVFSIPVTFTTDNSVLTCSPYLTTHKMADGTNPGFSISSESDKRAVVLKALEEIGDTCTTPKMRSEARSHTGSGYDTDQTNTYKTIDRINRKSFSKRNADRLRVWMNLNAFQDPLDELISGMTAAHGKALTDFIEQVAGRSPPGVIKPEKLQQLSRRDASLAEYKQYEDILSFLKGWGAMLSEVRPEYLVRYEDFMRISPNQKGWGHGIGAGAPTPQPKSGTSRQRMSERKFGHRQHQTWLTLLFQIIKVFVLSKVTWRGLKNLPQSHVIAARASEEKWSSMAMDPSTTGSNIYSHAESVLLRWLTIHQNYYFAGQSDSRIVTFDDLRDGRAFASVLCAYIPVLETRLGLNLGNGPATSGGGKSGLTGAASSGFVANPTSLSDCEKNASIVLEAAKTYGMDLKITSKEFVESSTRDLLLLALMLYQNLPQFVPQATVIFNGRLHETITKTVELTNPHRWPIDYLVLLDDEDGEFIIDRADNKVRLETRSSASLPIWTCPRFSKKCKARLTFLSVGRTGPNSASPIVFNVETDIDVSQATKTFSVESPLYEPLTHEFEIENPFNERANFSIQYTQQYVRDTNSKGAVIHYGEESSSSLHQDVFWTAQDVINVKKKDKAKLSFQFVPFMRGKYVCRIVLVDEKVGEVVYTINGTALPPLPFEKISFQTELTAPQSRDILLPLKNVALEKGIALLHNERFKGYKAKLKPSGDKKDPLADAVNVKYKVEYCSPFFTGPKEITPKTVDQQKETEGDARSKKPNTRNPLLLSVQFQPKGPGVYPGKIILTSALDVRVIEVDGKSRSPGLKADLEFICNARQVIQQELPLVNKTLKDWVISATLTGEHFTGPREVVVKAGKTKSYVLSFAPAWVCDIKGSLILKNSETLEKYTYNLTGHVEEPLAESTLTVDCVARESHTIQIQIPNISHDEVMYSVETDLPFARGAPTIIVPKAEVGKYTLVLRPTLSGKTTGSITFNTPNNHFVWFVIHVQCSRPPPETTIEVQTTVRKALMAEISIGNPTDQELSFAVRRRGDGLLGENRIILQPNESSVYNLVYNPLRATVEGQPSDGQLSFYNDEIGEYWYNVFMTASEAPPEEMPEVLCELGKSKSIELSISNPLDQDLTLQVHIGNTQNFTASPANTLTLKSFATVNPIVTFMPSAIAQRQEGIISYTHPKLGKWEFVVRGKGTPPTQMEVSTVHAVATRSHQTSVVFRNPFPLPRRFFISLKDQEKGKDSFALMIKRRTSTIGPFSSLTIPISYSPQEIAEHKVLVIVQAVGDGVADDLRWEYPIIGIAEAVPVGNNYKFICRSREELSQTVSVSLHQLDIINEDEQFGYDVVFPEAHPYKKALQGSLVVQSDSSKPTTVDGSIKMDFIVTFTPLRTFTATVELLVNKKSGGLWRYELVFESLPPLPDDSIVLEAAVAQRGSVAFTMRNIFPEEQAFRSYFSSDSAAEFTVAPAKGVLPPAKGEGSESTQFIVSFSSSQYGKTLLGTLLIETELMEWRYEVKGTLPRYHAPTTATSRVDTKLRNETQQTLRAAAGRKTDFIRQNQAATAPVRQLAAARSQQKLIR